MKDSKIYVNKETETMNKLEDNLLCWGDALWTIVEEWFKARAAEKVK